MGSKKAKRLLSIFLLVLFFAPAAQAQEPFKVYLPVILSCFNQDNNWRIIQPVASTNYVLNPSGEIAGSSADVAGGTTTRSTTYQKYGLYSYNVVTVAAGDGVSLDLLTLANSAHYVTLRARKSYPILQATLGTTTHTLRLIEKIDEDWDLLGVGFQAADANGATTVEITATATGDFYLDGIQVEPLAYWTTYIDGTQPGCGWLGTPHASASERSGASRAGGRSLDFWMEYGFQVQKVIGAGAATHKLGVDSYALLPGGELNSDKILSREFQIIGKFIAETEADLLEKKRALESAFYSNDTQLTRLRFNGGLVQKELAVRYQGGLEGDLATFYGNVEIVEDERYTEHELYTEKAAIQVVAPYPYWQEVGESAALLDTNDSATFRLVAGRLRSTGQWDELGPPNAAGTYTAVYALAEDDIYLYIGGDFLNWDNIANGDRIVRLNKQTGGYSAMGTGGGNGGVFALAIMPNGDVIAAGTFTSMGGVANTTRVARWDILTETWNAMAMGLDNTISALVVGLNGLLYAGGQQSNRVDSWNGILWSGVGVVANPCLALAIGPDGTLYAGGVIAPNGGWLSYWDGNSWTSIFSNANEFVDALAVALNSIVFIGGDFTNIGGVTYNYAASWNGTSLSPLGDGVNDIITTMKTAPDDSIYASGSFTQAGNVILADRLARFNRYAWANLDIDLPGSPTSYGILPGTADPVFKQKYDLWLGFNTTGTGTFAGLVTPTNGGNVAAYPRIVFTRSGGTSATVATLRNEDTGKELLFNYALLNGETLTIDLTPGNRAIISSFFGPRPDAILANSDFGSWALQPGDNDVSSFVINNGATITAWLTWREPFSGY
jgi:hypothetical protein